MQASIRNNQGGNKKGLSKAIILVLGWFMIVSLARDVWQMKKGFSRIDEAKRGLAAEEAKNQELRLRLSQVQKGEYREKLIREKLNMQKEHEVIAVLPETSSSEKDSLNPAETGEKLTNYQKWLLLIK